MPVTILGTEATLSSRPIDWSRPEWWDGTLLSLFHLHYHDYLAGASDDLAGDVIVDWIESNPASDTHAWRVPWHPYVISVRAVSWMQLLAERPHLFSTDDLAMVLQSLVAQLRYLERNLERDVGGNHLVRNARALVWAAAYFEGSEADRWRSTGTRLLKQILDEQILDDGFHFERSPSYHLQVLADLVECRSVLPASPLLERLDDALSHMSQVAVDLTHPDGLPSLMADGGLHMTSKPDDVVTAVKSVTRIPAPKPSPRFSYPQGGYHGHRSDRFYLLVDCGPIGADHLPAHGHGDILSFELTVDGFRFIVDAGVAEYEPGLRRAYARSTAAHNTVTLDGLDQAEFWSSFRVGRRPRKVQAHLERDDDTFRLVGSHDGYRHLPGAPIHRRRFVATDTTVVITDEISGSAGQSARSVILLHPDVTAQQRDGSWLLRRNQTTVELTTTSSGRLEEAHWSPDLGHWLPTSHISFEYGPAPTSAMLTLAVIP